MRLKLDSKIAAGHPDLRIAFFCAETKNYDRPEHKSEAEERIVALTSAHFADRPVNEHYMASLYTQFYSSFGLNPKRVSTPVKQVERVLRNRSWRSISPEIDGSMEIEFTTLFSAQVYDLDSLTGDLLTYRAAVDGDALIDMHGKTNPCRQGDLVFADIAGPIHSAMHGNALRCCISPATRRVLVRLMAVPGAIDSDFETAIAQLANRIEAKAVVKLSGTFPESIITTI